MRRYLQICYLNGENGSMDCQSLKDYIFRDAIVAFRQCTPPKRSSFPANGRSVRASCSISTDLASCGHRRCTSPKCSTSCVSGKTANYRRRSRLKCSNTPETSSIQCSVVGAGHGISPTYANPSCSSGQY